jgi:DUF1680 family protein
MNRLLVSIALLSQTGLSQIISPDTELGTQAFPFPWNEVHLESGRWQENQARTHTYLKAIDVDRLLYTFRATHGIDTKGAQPGGGWDAPDFQFRSHVQGHFLNAWAMCWAAEADEACKTQAETLVSGLRECQLNNDAAGFTAGYLSGFPESEIDKVHDRTLRNGNVPYYALHKTLAGLLDVWHHMDNQEAKDTLLAFADWVDVKTAALSDAQMQEMLQTEFGGMNEVLADIYHKTGDNRWLGVAERFEHRRVIAPLANNVDQLRGLHANTQVPKWIGAIRQYKATANSTYLDIARNAWNIVTGSHTYAIGANSQNEHFHEPNLISQHLTRDTAESCNTYNMLKLTRELWTLDPQASYFDFYERALINHMLGQQDPRSPHGHVTYFHPLQAGARRGVGPWLGGGTFSNDYDTFWCCQGTGLETNSKFNDAIYAHDESSLYVNLFIPSTLRWTSRGVTVSQKTNFPTSDETELTIADGSTTSEWTMNIRVPSWTSENFTITVNGSPQQALPKPGSYASITRTWQVGDRVVVSFPKSLRWIEANDDPGLAALAYGPIVLVGNYGDQDVNANPTLELESVQRIDETDLLFNGTAGGTNVELGPYYDAFGFNYVTYWQIA